MHGGKITGEMVKLKIKKKMKMMKKRKKMKKRMKKRKTMMMRKKLKLRKPPPVRELMLALTAVELLSLFRSLENIYFKKIKPFTWPENTDKQCLVPNFQRHIIGNEII